jgi:hypothetical protein
VYNLVLDWVDLGIGVLENELSADTRAEAPPPRQPAMEGRSGRRRFPRLLLPRTVPPWAVAVERVVFFLAALVGIVGFIGLVAGGWA